MIRIVRMGDGDAVWRHHECVRCRCRYEATQGSVVEASGWSKLDDREAVYEVVRCPCCGSAVEFLDMADGRWPS